MLRHILSFELRLRVKRVSTAVFFIMFLLVGYMAVVRGKGPLKLMGGVASGVSDTGAPYVLHFLINFMCYLGTLIVCAFFGQTGLRDFRDNMHGLYFSYPVRKIEYLAGRFAAALLAAIFVLAGTGTGAFLAGVAPAAKITAGGLARPAAYILPYLTGVLPTLLFTGTVFFALALTTRKMLPVYAGGTAIMILHLFGGALAQRTGTRLVGALVDPFGEYAAQSFYGVWSLAERNSRLIPLAGPFLLNRLIWLGAAVLIFIFLWRRFRFMEVEESGRRLAERRSPGAAKNDSESGLDAEAGESPAGQAIRRFDPATRLRQAARTASFEFGGLVSNAAFMVILILTTALQVFLGFRNIGLVRESTAYPLTSQVLASGESILHLVLLIVVLFCSGELLKRDRGRKVNVLMDAAPVPEWVFFMGKAAALVGAVGVVLALSMANGMIIQALQGWTRFQPGLYLSELFGVRLAYFAVIGIFALFIQVMIRNRFLGYAVTLFFIDEFLGLMGLEHRLWTFGMTPSYTYSDMNGYGPFGKSLVSYNIYWVFAAALIMVGALLLYQRGEDTRLRARIRELKSRWTRAKKIAAGIASFGCLAVGAYIAYNTALVNRFETTAAGEKRAADYEKSFKAYEKKPQPQTTAVSLSLDIFPEKRRVISQGEMKLANKTRETISEIFVRTPPQARVIKLGLDIPADMARFSETHAIRIFRLPDPLKPGAEIKIDFRLEILEKGFKDRDENTNLVHNGTFLDRRHVLPAVGYSRFEELDSPSVRKKYGLEPRKRLPPLGDREAKMSSVLGCDSGWIRYEAVLSTSKNQIALTSGELIETWEADGRRYFKYAARDKILHYEPFLSAAYEVTKDRWGDVGIEIYYHPGHDFNVERMIASAKKSLACFTEKFGPYPFRTLRIAEFPRYDLSAEAFPGIIPVSEGYGFIARHKGGGVEELSRVIAHEIGHQWWGMQTIGAGVEGEFLISETLAQHSALSVLRREYDEKTLADYMKSRIDRYLRGRAREHSAEKPLARTNFETTYVHYDKGMVVMNGLRELLGEAALDSAVRAFFEKTAYRESPYPTSEELIEELKKAAPQEARPAVADMLEDIVLYNNRALGAESKKLADGKYRVTLRFEAQKMKADEAGKESAAPFREKIEFALFDEKGKSIYRGMHPVEPATKTLEFPVGSPPARAGIDPFFLLVDKNPNDNITKVRSLD